MNKEVEIVSNWVTEVLAVAPPTTPQKTFISYAQWEDFKFPKKQKQADRSKKQHIIKGVRP
jgi:hypothetical protein